MESHGIVRRVVEEIAQAGVPEDPDASLFDAGVIDSFALMELIGKLEETFGVKVPDADLTPRKFESIGRIAAYFEARKGV